MDFKNWFLLLVVAGVIGIAIFSLQGQFFESQDEEATPTPQVASSSDTIPPTWNKYEGDILEFYYPEQWMPENQMPHGGFVVESIVLNIPDATDASLAFTATPFDTVPPDDIVQETEFNDERNNRSWTEWIRKGEGYVSYDMFTNDIPVDAGSLGVHVTLPEERGDVEEALNKLVSSIVFSEAAATESATSENAL